MGKRAVLYDLHVLATDTEEAERYEFDDAAKAVIGYNRLACERRRRAVLSKSGHLPGMEAEIIASYVPTDDAPPLREQWVRQSDRPIAVTLGAPQPAFPREQAAREDADETPDARRFRRQQDEMSAAAYWYAKGFIDCVGPLSPFVQGDAGAFSVWHAEPSNHTPGLHPIPEQWAIWSAKRREETGK